MRGLKIMFVIPGMDMGGAERQLIQKINLCPEVNIFLSVLSDRTSLLAEIALPQHNIKVYQRPYFRYLNARGIFKAIPTAFRIAMHCRNEKIQYLVAHLPMAHWVARWTVLLSSILFHRIRFIAYHHSEQYKVNPLKGFAAKTFNAALSLMAFITDSGNIFVSSSAMKDVSSHQYVRNGIVIKNMVREVSQNPIQAQVMLATYDKIFQRHIVIPGRVQRVKGQVFFISALTGEVVEKIVATNTLIVFAGGGADVNEVMRLVPDALKANVMVTGEIEHTLLLSYLSLADLVVIPSLSEGLGNTLIEAIMLKRKVLSSNAGGLGEIIRESNAIEWFESGDSIQLQTKLLSYFAEELLFHPEHAYRYYQANFTPEVHHVALLQYLKKTFHI